MLTVIALVTLVVALEKSSRSASRLTVFGGNSILVDRSKEMSVSDLHSYLACLSGQQLNGRRTFGPISLSVLHQRPYALTVLLDTDLKEDTSPVSNSIELTSTKDLFLRFPKHIVDSSYTVATTRVTKERLAELSSYCNGAQIDKGLQINGVTFSIENVAEERFLDDLLRAYSLQSQLAAFETQKPKEGLVQMTLISPFDLAQEKIPIARKLLFDAISSISASMEQTGRWAISVVHTDFRDSATYNPIAYTRARQMKMAPKMELVTSRFGESLASQMPATPFATTGATSAASGDADDRKRYTLSAAENRAPIGMPRKIVGDPLFHFEFWTIIFMIAVLVWVSAAMWNMKTFEDPFLMFTEYVHDQDATIMEDNL